MMTRRPYPAPPRILYSAALAVVICLSGCNKEPAAQEGKKGGKKGNEVVPVATAKVFTKDVPLDIQVIGNVEAYSIVSVKARVTGVIEKAHFREGDYVRKGQILFNIDQAPFQTALAQAEANLLRDRALLEQAKANLSRDMAQQKFLSSQSGRFASLQKEGVISREQAEQQQASVDVVAQAVNADKAAIASAEASVQAGEASVKTAHIMLGYTTVSSPVEGRTGTLTAKEGNLATANITELISISQVQPAFVSFAVPESQLGLIKDAMARGRLPVSAAPPDDPAHPETGTLTFIESTVDASTGTIKLKAEFANGNRKLWPGQFVRVTLRMGMKAGALLVPNQAVQTGQDGSFVYRVRPDSTVEMAKVATSGRVDQDIVIASGVEEGDTVVTEGQLRLAPNARVRLRGDESGARKGKGKGKKKEE